MRFAKAFTLIELLIVVAIIAILAAIAVPNFLEAQVRSKISRAQTDMRTQSVGIEAYAVDWNKYPFGYLTVRQANRNLPDDWPNQAAGRKMERMTYSQMRLTTPVAYLTSLPIDPFTVGSFQFDRTDDTVSAGEVYWYDDYQAWPNVKSDEGGYAYQARFLRIQSRGYKWSMSSAGPERRQMMMWLALDGNPPATANGHIVFPYDPSNGTISEGFVGRTNKGIYEEVNQP